MDAPNDDSKQVTPAWSWRGFWQGARLGLPVLPGTTIFALAFGTIAAQKGLTLLATTLMSAVVYAGASQLVAMEIWPARLTVTTVATLVAVATLVNLRMILMGAALRPWLGSLPAWQSYPALFLTTEVTWLASLRYHADGGRDLSFFIGNGLTIWVAWVAATMVGYTLGAIIPDPSRFGLDLILPIFFSVMLVPLWRGVRRSAGWVIAGVVALASAWLLPGYWFIVIGALAGSIAGGFLDDRG